ncbi:MULTISPECIES: hypothetical protein [Ensifer]|uniref:hypothetical protein n=1 Tax=Ensifer TaxID=106591 RepID=UPI00080752D8|nr:hypothetical protein [Ensifer adhaerens]
MMTMLRGLHSIAAQRGDGLRPELLRMIRPSQAWSGVEHMGSAACSQDTDSKPADEMDQPARSAKVLAMPSRKRNVRILEY